MTEHVKDLVSDQHLGAGPCRATEFSKYNRVMLQHERAYLSKVMASQAGYMSSDEKDAIMHDLTDIDVFLAKLGSEQLVKAPEYFGPACEVPIEMWPASEGPVPPSQRKS